MLKIIAAAPTTKLYTEKMINFLDFSMYCKSLIAKNPTTPETTTPTIYAGMSCAIIAFSATASLKLTAAPARMVGIERMNVYCAQIRGQVPMQCPQ